MPDSYEYYFIQNIKGDENIKLTKLYRFKSLKSKRVYIVRIECYDMNVYAIKFYLKCHRFSENKYNLLSNDYEPRRIVLTCISILKEIYKDDIHSSFAFIGANCLGEPNHATRRFFVYKKIITTFFGVETFEHRYNESNSAYILVRKTEIENNPDFIDKIEKSFSSIYSLAE